MELIVNLSVILFFIGLWMYARYWRKMCGKAFCQYAAACCGREEREKLMRYAIIAGNRHATLLYALTYPELFDKAVEFIKRAEGWHRGQMPYIGYGHCLLPGETLTENLSKAQADSLLRSDLRKCCDAFREFENDALLLGVLSYNVGIFRLKGHGRMPKSRLIRKLEKGERDIYEEYVSFRCYKGKVIPSIERRRKAEFALFYIP